MLDFLTDETGDMILDGNGGFVVGESSLQHQQFLIIMQKGELKENPERCVGIERYLNGNETGMVAEIRSQFVKDGMTVTGVTYNDQTGNLAYNANYIS